VATHLLRLAADGRQDWTCDVANNGGQNIGSGSRSVLSCNHRRGTFSGCRKKKKTSSRKSCWNLRRRQLFPRRGRWGPGGLARPWSIAARKARTSITLCRFSGASEPEYAKASTDKVLPTAAPDVMAPREELGAGMQGMDIASVPRQTA